MTRFEKMQTSCRNKNAVKLDAIDDTTEVCGYNRDRKCLSGSCPSLNYWGGDKQVGWHEERALDQTGLKEAFEEEIAAGEK